MSDYPKLEIWFSKVRIKKKWKIKIVHRCGVGDCVVDGTYAEGRTKAIAALNFVKQYNKESYLKIHLP
jgi:hypothetical protein